MPDAKKIESPDAGIDIALANTGEIAPKSPEEKPEKAGKVDEIASIAADPHSQLPEPTTAPSDDPISYVTDAPDPIKYVKGDSSVPKRNKDSPLGKGSVSDTVYEQRGNSDRAIKIIFGQREYIIGAALNHPVLAKSHQLYIREDERGGLWTKHKMVMERIKGKKITECNISNDQVVNLMEEAKSCCLYLFRAEACWSDINFGNVIIEDTGHLKLIDFGSWFVQEASPEAVGRLLIGAMELTGWIIGNSTLVKEERKQDALLRKIQLPEFFFEEQINKQIFSDGQGGDILRAYQDEPWMQRLQKKVSVMDKKQMESFISEYFDSVIALFKEHRQC